MANKVRIEINLDGLWELLKSSEIMEACKEAAKTIQNNYGKHTQLEEYTGPHRVNVAVVAPFEEASNNNELIKAVHE